MLYVKALNIINETNPNSRYNNKIIGQKICLCDKGILLFLAIIYRNKLIRYVSDLPSLKV